MGRERARGERDSTNRKAMREGRGGGDEYGCSPGTRVTEQSNHDAWGL